MNRDEVLMYLADKFSLDLSVPSPIDIPDINRLIAAQTLAELGYTTGAEIGVAAGDHSKLLLDTIPGLTLYSIDPWVPSFDYCSFRGSTLRNWKEEALNKLAPYPNCHIMQTTSMEAAQKIPKEMLDFVYIDGAHDFKNIAMDICEWIRRVRPGGILYGHDYVTIHSGRYKCHVKDVVDGYARSHLIQPWFVMRKDKQSKINRRFSEDIPEWMFVL